MNWQLNKQIICGEYATAFVDDGNCTKRYVRKAEPEFIYTRFGPVYVEHRHGITENVVPVPPVPEGVKRLEVNTWVLLGKLILLFITVFGLMGLILTTWAK
jgi:hypothetical protein